MSEASSGQRGVWSRKAARIALGVGVGVVASLALVALNWGSLRPVLTSDTTLVTIGVLLSVVVVIAWVMSNRHEATPNEDQLAEMRHFVDDHFAKYVARGLAAEGGEAIAISQDPAWRKVYLQHLRLHNELYSFRRDVALRVFEAHIDTAVRRELAIVRAAGQRANPAVSVS